MKDLISLDSFSKLTRAEIKLGMPDV